MEDVISVGSRWWSMKPIEKYEVMRKMEKIAIDHYEWFERVMRRIYIDAFVHGAKHALEELEKMRCEKCRGRRK